ncbi:hypothetical protein [Legionella fairfieldensis]|nr:hypothetical protein [Legionella fairfieldensis]
MNKNHRKSKELHINQLPAMCTKSDKITQAVCAKSSFDLYSRS